MNIFTVGGFLELLKISSIFVLILFITMNIHNFFCSVGINTLFLACVILGFRLLVPFNLPITLKITCPFLISSLFDWFDWVIYSSIKVYHLLIFVWIFVATVKIVKLYIDYKQFICLLWALSKAAPSFQFVDTLKKVLKEIPLKSNFTIIVSDQIKHPFVVGLKKIFIALPLKEYSEVQLRHIISHELLHVKSFDFLWKAFFELLSLIYWWFPLMYLLKKQFFRLLEIRNDSKYVDGLTPSEQYSYLSCILNESETNYSYNRFVLAFSTYSRSFLSQRFFMILNQESKINVKIQFVNLLIYLILFILSISISISFVPHTP